MISVVIATYNEEDNMTRFLESVKGFADEIIVVDGSSTDGTVEIAKKYGAHVFLTDNKPIFHINKQMAMDKAKGELILQMDADEVVDQSLSAFIQKVHERIMKQDTANLPAAWWIKRKNWFLGKFLTKGGQYPDPVIRLYQRGKAKLPQKDVHEQMEVNGEVGFADGHILHYGTPTFTQYIRKWNDYTSLKATQLKEQGVSVTFFTAIQYLFIKPIVTFLSLYIRHKGIVDGYPGFVFAVYSGLYHAVSFLKLWELQEKKKV